MPLQYITIPLLSFICIQIIKALIDSRGNRTQALLRYGGMPSAHTGITVSLMTTVALNQGIESPFFGIAFVYGLLVIIDAVGIRPMLAKNDALLAKAIDDSGEKKSSTHSMYKRFGHTPLQALIGGSIGFVISYVIHYI